MSKKQSIGQSLSEYNPELTKELHPTKNGDFNPSMVGVGSSKKVWWKCTKGEDHVWQARISNRHKLNHGCPVCSNQLIVNSNCLATINPELAKEWHPTKNGDSEPAYCRSWISKKSMVEMY